ncbi:MAG: hypothetical protein ACREGJ_03820 [Candidatus Saccharimonadales bacterium]
MESSGHLRQEYKFLMLLVGLFALSIAGQFIAQALTVKPFSWDAFWPHFLGLTLANWQATFLQLLILVVLLMYLLRGAKKRNDEEVIHKRLQRIEKQLAILNNQWAPRVKQRE